MKGHKIRIPWRKCAFDLVKGDTEQWVAMWNSICKQMQIEMKQDTSTSANTNTNTSANKNTNKIKIQIQTYIDT